jgi:ferrous iron transport protein A
VRLSEVGVGATVVVQSVAPGQGGLGRRLEDLGFLAGTVVRVERRAPLGDPMVYELRGVRLAVRRADVALVEVTEVPDGS